MLITDDRTCHTARIIQWLGGERAVDVPTEFDVTSSSKEATDDGQIVSSEVECIELLRHQPLNKQVTPTFKRACLLRRSSRNRLSRLSSDVQTSDEAYCTLSSHRSKPNADANDLIRQSLTSDTNSSRSLSSTTPVLSLSIDDIYQTFDRKEQIITPMENNPVQEEMGLLREIVEQNLHLLPMITDNHDQPIESYRQMLNENDRNLKEIVEEFVQLIEKKLSDAEMKMFDINAIRPSSPSLFDTLHDLKTCVTLLRRTEIQSLLNVFDSVLKLHSSPLALPETEEPIIHTQSHEELRKLCEYAIDELKIVQIEKSNQPLGITISRTDSGTIHIARIVVGGLAATTQLFQVDDRILEINDQPITGHSLDYICTLMCKTTGLMKFLLSPPKTANPISYQTFHVRALYAYDPFTDPLIPCKQLGLSFQRGDILRIVAREENLLSYVSWWQAYRENSIESESGCSLAALVPSDSLQQKRADLLRVISDETDSISSSSSSPLVNGQKKGKRTCFSCVSAKHERKCLENVYNNLTFVRDTNDQETPTIRTSTNHFSLTDTRQFDEEQSCKTLKRFSESHKATLSDSFRFYESVFRLDLSVAKTTRPIVLLGAPNVGRHELRRRLLQNEPSLFDVAIPHTTRARRFQETPDVDYHFVSEADFLAQVACHSFVEFGQYGRDLYGTSLDDIRHIVQIQQKICILNLNPDAIPTFNKTDLYPYIVCIAAPSFERLKRLELDRHEHLTEKDYREILRKSRTIERRHALLFDHILINNDLDRTYLELRDLIVRIQHENEQWVRACYRR